jgi:hypothetical protein
LPSDRPDRLIFLDTNVVLDLAFELRPRHDLILGMFERRMVGRAEPLLYTDWVRDELDRLLKAALQQVRAAVLDGIRRETGWDELSPEDRDERAGRWLGALVGPRATSGCHSVVDCVLARIAPSLLSLRRDEVIRYFEEQAVGLEWMYRERLLAGGLVLARHRSPEGRELEVRVFKVLAGARRRGAPLFRLERDDEFVDAHNLAELLSFLAQPPLVGGRSVRGSPLIEFWTADRELEERCRHVKENAEGLGIAELVGWGSLSKFSVVPVRRS